MVASASAFSGRADQRAESADHGEDAGKVALVEGVHGDIGADQIGDDVGLQVGEGEHQVGLERQYLRHVGGDEGSNARLLFAHLRRPHRIARDADDAMVFAEEIERLHGFFGQADDSARAGTYRIIHWRWPAGPTSFTAAMRPASSITTRLAMRFTSPASWLT